MNDNYKQFGIYRITNTKNGWSYIGQTTVNFGDRWDSHRSLLRHGCHYNACLQKEWDEYGEGQFEFAVVEVLSSTKDIDSREAFFIQECREQSGCYNIADGGKAPPLFGKHMKESSKKLIAEKNRQHMLGKRMSDETRRKMSLSQKKRYEQWTDQDRADWGEKVRLAKSNCKKWSDESKEAFSKRQETRPNGAKYSVETIRKIRMMHEQLNMSNSEIADELKMNRGTVYGITTYRRWKNA